MSWNPYGGEFALGDKGTFCCAFMGESWRARAVTASFASFPLVYTLYCAFDVYWRDDANRSERLTLAGL